MDISVELVRYALLIWAKQKDVLKWWQFKETSVKNETDDGYQKMKRGINKLEIAWD